MLFVTLKQSKTDKIWSVGVGSHGEGSMADYLVSRGQAASLLFIYSDGSFLMRDRFVEEVWSALGVAGEKVKSFNSHSFRIGAATVARQLEVWRIVSSRLWA